MIESPSKLSDNEFRRLKQIKEKQCCLKLTWTGEIILPRLGAFYIRLSVSKPHTSELNCNFRIYLSYVVPYILDAVI